MIVYIVAFSELTFCFFRRTLQAYSNGTEVNEHFPIKQLFTKMDSIFVI